MHEDRYISTSFTTSTALQLPLCLIFEQGGFFQADRSPLPKKLQYMNQKTIRNREEVGVLVTRAELMN